MKTIRTSLGYAVAGVAGYLLFVNVTANLRSDGPWTMHIDPAKTIVAFIAIFLSYLLLALVKGKKEEDTQV